MATGGQDGRLFPPCSEMTNYARLCRMIVDLCTEILRELLSFHCTHQSVPVLAHRCPRRSLNSKQWNQILSATTNGFADFDITLIYTLLRNSGSVIPPPNGGWGLQTLPGTTDVAIGDDIERIRIIRNEVYGHLPNTKVTSAVYQNIVTELQGVTTRFDQRFLSNRWNRELNQIITDVMDPDIESRYITIVKDLAESEIGIRIQLGELSERMDGMDERIDLLETDLKGLGVTCRLTPEALTVRGITQSLIQLHREDKIFVSTRATDAGLDFLCKYGVAIFSGTSGSGKTLNAIEVMKLMQDKEGDILLLMISDLKQLESCVNPDLKSVVVFDDFLGKTNINEMVLSEGGDTWNKIYAIIRARNVKVLMTIRSHILAEAFDTLGMFDLFRKEHFIDLSSETFKLTNQNKRDIFERHCRANNITICDVENQENYQSAECLDKGFEVKLSGIRVKDIIFSNPFLGFPQSCFMFCRERKYTQLGATFFIHPTKSMVQQFEKMRRSRNGNESICFCLLVYILLNNSVNLNHTNMDMIERIRRGLGLENEIRHFDLDDAVNDMKTYLKSVGQSDIFEFQHQTILESVAIASVKQIPDLILELCPNDFIYEFIRTQGYVEKTGEVRVKLRRESYIHLIRRFIADFLNDRGDFASHCAFDDHEFVLEFINELSTVADVSTLLQNDCKRNWGIFMTACMFGKHRLFKEYCKMVKVPSEILQKGAEHAMKCDRQSVIIEFLIFDKFTKNNRQTLSSLVHCINSDSDFHEVVFAIESALNFEKEETTKKLFQFACIYENAALAKFIIEKFSHYIDDKTLIDTLKGVCVPSNHNLVSFIASKVRWEHFSTDRKIAKLLLDCNFHTELLQKFDIDRICEKEVFKVLSKVSDDDLVLVHDRLSTLKNQKYFEFFRQRFRHSHKFRRCVTGRQVLQIFEVQAKYFSEKY